MDSQSEMTYDPANHHRRSIRLPGYDYRQAGAYFVTLVCKNRELLLEDDRFRAIVEDAWRWLAERHEFVSLYEYVVMPNHLHGIIVIREACRGGSRTAPTVCTSGGKPLGRLIGAFKTVSTKRINGIRGTPGLPVWQRNYYEHVIRNDDELNHVRQYVIDNRLHWDQDPENPAVAQAMGDHGGSPLRPNGDPPMTRFSLRLPRRQARLVALAVAYHLARPGAELDRETMREYEHGLAEVPPALDPQLDGQEATLELHPLQVTLLATALSSVVNELKTYSMLDATAGGSPRSVARGFDDKLRSLFPEVAADAGTAADLAGDAALLRRQLPLARARELLEEQHHAAEQKRRPHKKPWQFWKR